MRIKLLLVCLVVGFFLAPVAARMDPNVADAQGLKHELVLEKLTRDHDSGKLKLLFSATGFERDWIRWHRGPRIARLVDAAGKRVLNGYYRDDKEGEKQNMPDLDWNGRGESRKLVTREMAHDQFELIGSIEVFAEIGVAREVEFIDLGELKGLDTKIDIAPGAMLEVKANVEARSCGFQATLRDSRKDPDTRVLVGIETFDSAGNPSGSWANGERGFDGIHLYERKDLVAKTGRLVIANRIEQIPIKLDAKNIRMSGASLKDVQVMTDESLRKRLENKDFTEEDVNELLLSAIRLSREDLANVLVDSGAKVSGEAFWVQASGPEVITKAESDSMRDRLFLRHIEVASRTKNQRAIDFALGLALGRDFERFLPVVLKCNPRLVWTHDEKRDYLMEMRMFHKLIPEIANAYASEVLGHGEDFEAASRSGFTEFLAAAYMGENARLAALVKSGTDVNQTDERGSNVLDWACVSPHATVETAKLLLDAGVETGSGKDGSRVALVTALESKRNDLALVLIQNGAVARITDRRDKVDALRLAAGTGSVEVLSACLEGTVQTDWPGAAGMIQEAGKSGNADVLKIALEYVKKSGLDAATRQRALDSGLGESVRAGKVKTVKMLLEAGADFSAGPLPSILARAVERPDDEIFDIILAEADKKNLLSKIGQGRKLNLGLETMIAACGVGKTARVEKLIELGVVPTGEANESGNVLTEAARSGSVELVKLLLDKGVDVNAPGRGGGNAIFWAAGPKWSPELLQLLASKGADVKIAIPRSGRPTVISNALASGDEALVKEVLKLGAPISVRIDSRVHDVLADAIFRRDVRAVQILLRVGVKPGNCEGAIGPSGNVSNHLDLARQMVGSVDSAQTRETLKMIEEAGK